MSYMKTKRLAVATATLAALAALTAGVVAHRTSSAQAPGHGAPSATPVSVATVETVNIATWDEFSGRLEAVERVDVRSRVAGAVQSVHFSEGALVRRGDLLVTIDPAPFAAEVDRAQAQVIAARARLTYAQGEGERARRLWEERAIAQRELDQRVNNQAEADANLRAAEAALQMARLNLSYTEVRAPVAGRVGKLEVTVGNLVPAGPGAPVLTTLVSVTPIYASFDADEQVVAQALRDLKGSGDARTKIERIPVEIATADSGSAPIRGHLQLVDNQVNAKSGTVRVRAVFDNPGGNLMHGQYAKVRMGRSTTTPALLVNERAIGTDQNKKYVMVVGADNTAAYREVSLGTSAHGLRVVSSGLNAGERIVVSGLQRIRPGSLVLPQPMQMAQSTSRVVGADPNSGTTQQ